MIPVGKTNEISGNYQQRRSSRNTCTIFKRLHAVGKLSDVGHKTSPRFPEKIETWVDKNYFVKILPRRKGNKIHSYSKKYVSIRRNAALYETNSRRPDDEFWLL